MPQDLPTWMQMGQGLNPLDQNQAVIDAQNVAANQARSPASAPVKAPQKKQGLAQNINLTTTNNTDVLASILGNLQNQYDTPESFAKKEDILRNSQSFKNEQNAINQDKDYLSALASNRPKAQVDLTPLYNFAHQITNGKVGIIPPAHDDTDQYQAILQKYAKDLSTRTKDLNELPLKHLKDLVIGKTTDTTKEDQKNSVQSVVGTKPVGGAGASGFISPTTALNKFDSLDKEHEDNQAGIQNYYQLINKGSLADLGTIAAMGAKYLDKGTSKSMNKIMATVFPKNVRLSADGLEMYIEGDVGDTKIPADLQALLSDRGKLMEANMEAAYANKHEHLKNTINALPHNFDVGAASSFSAPQKKSHMPVEATHPQKSPLDDMSTEEIAKIFKSLGKK